jgi:hypothetical protein
MPADRQETLAEAEAIAQTALIQSKQAQIQAADTGPAYTPGNLHPITTSLPKQQVSNRPQKNPISTGDMSPLPLDSFDFTQILRENAQNPQQETLLSPAQTTNKSQAAPAVLAPDIQDDPVLATIMRQAQMGLYALPQRGSRENVSNSGSLGNERADFLL